MLYEVITPIPQIGVFTKSFVASFECSKYVVTISFILFVIVPKSLYVGFIKSNIFVSLSFDNKGSSICTVTTSFSFEISLKSSIYIGRIFDNSSKVSPSSTLFDKPKNVIGPIKLIFVLIPFCFASLYSLIISYNFV